ncbi:hypothetical protein I7I48_01595 [Histoplasma ohiense]|nr:hypothetical protein I7I48_01595 [Histoplasma ohiense (nom. inval.)]
MIFVSRIEKKSTTTNPNTGARRIPQRTNLIKIKQRDIHYFSLPTNFHNNPNSDRGRFNSFLGWTTGLASGRLGIDFCFLTSLRSLRDEDTIDTTPPKSVRDFIALVEHGTLSI